jgi:RNA polymerase sigma-70 factor (ECF subfamily)
VDTDDASRQPERHASEEEAGSAEFETFFRAYYRELMRHAIYAGATLHEAEDVTHTTMEQVYRRWASIEQPRAYAHKALASNLKKLKRRLDRRSHHRIECEDTASDGCLDARLTMWEDGQWVSQLIGSLSPAQQEVMAFAVDGYKPGEIAELLGIRQGTVSQRLFAARQTRKHALQAQLDADRRMPRRPSPAEEVTE